MTDLRTAAVDLATYGDDGQRFIRYYSDYVACDFCGEQTRGRVYESAQSVTCGSCSKEIATDENRLENGDNIEDKTNGHP